MKITSCDKCGKELGIDKCTLRTTRIGMAFDYNAWHAKYLDLCVPCFKVITTLLEEALAAKEIETGVCNPPE